MALSGNKGEWSEVYVLLKLLGDKELHPGDENLDKVKGLVYPILKVLRNDKTQISYTVDSNLVIVSDSKTEIKIPVLEFVKEAKSLFKKIKTTSGNLSYPEIETFLEEICCSQLKASSANKSDITIQIHDSQNLINPLLGFSIKSQLGSPSTLLNASGATNFIYKISGGSLTEQDVKDFNSKKRFTERFSILISKKCRIELLKLSNQTFRKNLVLIDSKLPEILAELILKYYSTGESNIKVLTDAISKTDPLHFGTDSLHPFYHYKIKKLLTDYALGMMASKVWLGEYESTGGYLIVKNDGEIICYHFYNRNLFENYLLSNTRFETASTTRHGFGNIYKIGSDYLLNLNLQIRFIV